MDKQHKDIVCRMKNMVAMESPDETELLIIGAGT